MGDLDSDHRPQIAASTPDQFVKPGLRNLSSNSAMDIVASWATVAPGAAAGMARKSAVTADLILTIESFMCPSIA